MTAAGVAGALTRQPDLRVIGSTAVSSPTQALVDAARDAEVVVIGTRGFRPVVGTLLGSVAFGVAARAASPMMVVSGEPEGRPVGPAHPVVVGTDGYGPAEAAVAYAADRAVTASAEFHVITCTGGREVSDVAPERLTVAAHEIADAAAQRLRTTHPGLRVITRVEDCPPERTLVDASSDAGTVVVGTRGRGSFQGLLLGSVSHAVIHGAQCPVAVITDVPREPAQPG